VVEFVEAMTIAGLLWMRRNKWVFEGQISPPSHVIQQAQDVIESYAQAHSSSHHVTRISEDDCQKWTKPLIGVEVVVRDDHGRVVASLACAVPGIDHPTMAESWAAWQAVELCCVLGFRKYLLRGIL
jgi:hypothetical protein